MRTNSFDTDVSPSRQDILDFFNRAYDSSDTLADTLKSSNPLSELYDSASEDYRVFECAKEAEEKIKALDEPIDTLAYAKLANRYSSDAKDALRHQEGALYHRQRTASQKDATHTNGHLVALEKEIVQKWDILSENGNLKIYSNDIWNPLSFNDFYSQLRVSELNCDGKIEYLDMSDVKKLYERIKSNPRFYHRPGDPPMFKPDPNIICLEHGSYNILSDRIIPSDPNHYCTYRLLLPADSLRRPRNHGYFDRFVDSSLEGDSKLRQLLLEMIGLIVSNQQAKACLVFVGASNSGKSILVDFLRKLLGNDRIHQIGALDELSGRWLLGQLENKSLLLCTECEDENISAKSCAVLKSVSGEPIIVGDRKGKEYRTFSNTAHILLVSNSMLHPEKKDQALANRFVFLPFPVSIPPEQQNPNLLDDLLEDAGYIVREAMSALRGLIDNNFQFTQPDPEYLEALESDSQDLSSSYSVEASINRFVSDLCVLDTDSKVEIALLYNAYVCFCSQQGMSVNTSKKLFSQTLCRMIPDLIPNRYYFYQADGSKKQSHGILGIRLAQDENFAQDIF